MHFKEKTQYMTCNTSTITTSFSSKLTTTDDITTNGNLTGNQIICPTGSIDSITTSQAQTQNIFGSVVNIGTTGINSVNIGSATSVVYINGLIYLPFSSASSFFSQW